MAEFSELLLLTAEFSLDEREVTPRAGIWIDEPSSQPRYVKSIATPVRTDVPKVSEELSLQIPGIINHSASAPVHEHSVKQDIVESAPQGIGEPTLNSDREFEDAGPNVSELSDVQSIEEPQAISFPVLQGSGGVFLSKHKAAIRNVSNVETSWFLLEGGETLKAPPILDSSLHLAVGDLFLHFQATNIRSEVKIWMIVHDDIENKGLVWRRFKKHPITHPILQDRTLGFVVAKPTTPTWVQASTYKKFQKNQPTIVDD